MPEPESCTPCSLCSLPAKKRGFCQSHYYYHWKHGLIPIHRPTLLQVKLGKLLKNITERCSNPGTNSYNRYGGRGIKNQLTMDDLEFLWNKDAADQLERPSIDRREVDDHYTRDNCRFIEQRANTRRGPACTQCGQWSRGMYKGICRTCRPSRAARVTGCVICGAKVRLTSSQLRLCGSCLRGKKYLALSP